MKKICVFLTVFCLAQSATQAMLVNGDAELGDFTGWTLPNKITIMADYFETLNLSDAIHIGEENNPEKYLVGLTGPAINSVDFNFDLQSLPDPLTTISVYMDTLEVNYDDAVKLNGIFIGNLQKTNSANLIGLNTLEEKDAAFFTDSFQVSASVLNLGQNTLSIYPETSGSNTDDITLTNIWISIPEPATLALFSFGGLLLCRRKKQ